MAVEKIQIVEVGARDGLQNESTLLATLDKVKLVELVADAGIRRVEVASFVHPRLVPQMADAEAVVAALAGVDGINRIGLVLNQRGLDRALATAVDEFNFVVGASEGFNRANQRASVTETMASIEEMLPVARDAGRTTTVTISVAFGCPYDGEVPVSDVVDLVERAEAAGADEIALGDTIGVAAPSDVAARIAPISTIVGIEKVRCHFHDTRNTGVANVVAAVDAGVQVIDSSVGGAGGCPYAPNASGNVASEDVVYTLHRLGFETGIDNDKMIDTGRWLGKQLGKALPSAVGRAGNWPS